MTTETTPTTERRTGYDLIRGLLANDVDQKVATVIGQAVIDLEHTEADLIRTGRSIVDTVTRVDFRLAQGHHLNSLGELQSTGPKYDLLVAKRQQQIESLHVLVNAFGLADEDEAFVWAVVRDGTV